MEIRFAYKSHGEAGEVSITQLVNELCPSKKSFQLESRCSMGREASSGHQGRLWMDLPRGHCSLMSGAGLTGWGWSCHLSNQTGSHAALGSVLKPVVSRLVSSS